MWLGNPFSMKLWNRIVSFDHGCWLAPFRCPKPQPSEEA
jgi:hypothetical protein